MALRVAVDDSGNGDVLTLNTTLVFLAHFAMLWLKNKMMMAMLSLSSIQRSTDVQRQTFRRYPLPQTLLRLLVAKRTQVVIKTQELSQDAHLM